MIYNNTMSEEEYDGRVEKPKKTILIIEDDPKLFSAFKQGFNYYDFKNVSVELVRAEDLQTAVEAINSKSPYLVFFDHHLSSDTSNEGTEIAKLLVSKGIKGISISYTSGIAKNYPGDIPQIKKDFQAIYTEIMKIENL